MSTGLLEDPGFRLREKRGEEMGGLRRFGTRIAFRSDLWWLRKSLPGQVKRGSLALGGRDGPPLQRVVGIASAGQTAEQAAARTIDTGNGCELLAAAQFPIVGAGILMPHWAPPGISCRRCSSGPLPERAKGFMDSTSSSSPRRDDEDDGSFLHGSDQTGGQFADWKPEYQAENVVPPNFR